MEEGPVEKPFLADLRSFLMPGHTENSYHTPMMLLTLVSVRVTSAPRTLLLMEMALLLTFLQSGGGYKSQAVYNSNSLSRMWAVV